MKADRIELQVREYDRGGEAVICLHFGGANLMAWQRIVPDFRSRYRLVLVDLRGHGRSDRPEGGYHIDVMAGDIVGIMGRLGIERAHIVGSSMGAEIGLSLAANHPAKVLSLVCDGALSSEFGPFGTWAGSRAEFLAHAASQVEKLAGAPEAEFPSLEAFLEQRRRRLEKFGYWNVYMEAVERHGAVRTEAGTFLAGFRKKAMADYLSHYFHCRFETYYERVRCPLLMVAGKQALENPRELKAAEGLCRLAKNARLARLPGWDHPYGWLVDPADMSRTILEFLATIRQA